MNKNNGNSIKIDKIEKRQKIITYIKIQVYKKLKCRRKKKNIMKYNVCRNLHLNNHKNVLLLKKYIICIENFCFIF